MKTELKAKFLQHMVQKKQDKGFTLIELLVVIIIIGILSAIALPSFLNQAAKAKQTEAKTFVGAVIRAQQAYRIDKNSFAESFSTLEIGLPTETTDYKYPVPTAEGATKGDAVNTTAVPLDVTSLKAYVGRVQVLTNGQTATGACQSKGPAATATPPTINAATGEYTCAEEKMR
jgi:type IV pilus assembly protein PilA